MWQCNLADAEESACFLKIIPLSSSEVTNLIALASVPGLQIVPVLRVVCIRQLQAAAVIMPQMQTLRSVIQRGDVASWALTLIPKLCQVTHRHCDIAVGRG